ncbi:hypothetical protein QUF64_09765 [Anaerolineales bacterium HSG6]|nr:hypothetical protein [Anaerolineales bacterium HSG6]MDM8531416.1 hypothetical protein [Anaerolineales bacterium HSG25]
MAQTAYKVPSDKDDLEFAGFQDWVAVRYNVHSNQSWAQIIRSFAKDEPESLDLFFELLDKYKKGSSYSMPELEYAQEPIERAGIMEFA